MVRRILVPLDGSSVSESVLPHVGRLRKALGAEVCVVTVAGRSLAARNAAQAYLDGLGRRYRKLLPAFDTVVLQGPVAGSIIGHGLFDRSELIVMATHGRSGLRRAMFGSVAEQVLRSSPIPVYLARPDAKPLPLRRVLVPLDGSQRAASVLPLAGEICRASKARMLLMTALSGRVPDLEADRTIETALREARARGIRCELLVRQGDPARSLLEVVEERGVELVAMATHGRRGLDRLRFGSVTEAVLRKLRQPMLVIRTAGVPEEFRKGR